MAKLLRGSSQFSLNRDFPQIMALLIGSVSIQTCYCKILPGITSKRESFPLKDFAVYSTVNGERFAGLNFHGF